MKTETQISKENVKFYKFNSKQEYFSYCFRHLQSCQRFLVFLEQLVIFKVVRDLINQGKEYKIVDNFLKEKIQDLQQAIKIYEEVGIK